MDKKETNVIQSVAVILAVAILALMALKFVGKVIGGLIGLFLIVAAVGYILSVAKKK